MERACLRCVKSLPTSWDCIAIKSWESEHQNTSVPALCIILMYISHKCPRSFSAGDINSSVKEKCQVTAVSKRFHMNLIFLFLGTSVFSATNSEVNLAATSVLLSTYSRSLITCSSLCSDTNGCVSVNFNKSSKICLLLSNRVSGQDAEHTPWEYVWYKNLIGWQKLL